MKTEDKRLVGQRLRTLLLVAQQAYEHPVCVFFFFFPSESLRGDAAILDVCYAYVIYILAEEC